MIHIYTGDGKGKTTAALGLALRSAGCGNGVLICQFLKGRDTGELHSLNHVPGIRLLRLSRDYGFCRRMTEEARQEVRREHDEMLRCALGNWNLIVLDECIGACNHGLLDTELLMQVLDRPAEIVLTGRNAPETLLSKADYITEMKKLRHPFDLGIAARKGVEY